MGRLRVTYPEVRQVFVDGGAFGRTNETNVLANGTYTVDLGQPRDYTPATQQAKVVTLGVTVVSFTPLAAMAAAAPRAMLAPKPTGKQTAKRKAAKKKRPMKKAAARGPDRKSRANRKGNQGKGRAPSLKKRSTRR